MSKKAAKKESTSKDTNKSSKSNANTAISSLSVYQQHDDKWFVLIGCKDGTVNIFDASNMSATQLDPVLIYGFTINSLHVSNVLLSQVQSINVFDDQSRHIGDDDDMLVCISTRSCDVLEVKVSLDVMSKSAVLYQPQHTTNKSSSVSTSVSASVSSKSVDLSSGIVIQSHFSDELWGISTHPHLPQYCSVGDDKTLRFYSIHQRSLMRCINLGLIARTCCYNSDGKYVAVGFGGRLGKGA